MFSVGGVAEYEASDTINVVLEQYSQLSSLVIPSHTIMLLEKLKVLSCSPCCQKCSSQSCLCNRQLFVGRKWYYMHAFIRTFICSTPHTKWALDTLAKWINGMYSRA